MKEREIQEWLEGEIRGYPTRAMGNEAADFVIGLAARLLESDRDELVGALRDWIDERHDRSLLATRITAEYRLLELAPDLKRLIAEVEAGRAFMPYFALILTNDLERLEGREPPAARG